MYWQTLFKWVGWVAVVVPLRNSDYYDGMRFIHQYKHQLLNTNIEKNAWEKLETTIADRSVAVRADRDGFGCLQCNHQYPTAMSYLIHRCNFAKNQNQENLYKASARC